MYINFLLNTSRIFSYFSTIVIAALPFLEVKGAIPIGMGLGLSPLTSLFCAFIGSMLPVPFLLNLITPLMEYLEKSKKYGKLLSKMNAYIHDKLQKFNSPKVQNFVDRPVKIFALFFFVLLPLPGTGVWSGSVVASVLKLKKSHAFLAIALANLITSLLIFLATYGFFLIL